MAETLVMPKWGLTMEQGTIVEWMVGEGEEIVQGDVLATVESEKAEVELTSPYSGVVARILVADGETVDVGAPLALIAVDAAEVARIKEQ